MNKILEKIGIKRNQGDTEEISLMNSLKNIKTDKKQEVQRVKEMISEAKWTTRSEVLKDFLLKKRTSNHLPESYSSDLSKIQKRNKCSFLHYIDEIPDHLKSKIDTKELQCPICMDYLMKTCTTICGHSFCYFCLEEALLNSFNCPTCRNSIKSSDFTFSNSLDNFIKYFVNSTECSKSVSEYEKKCLEYEKWKNKRL